MRKYQDNFDFWVTVVMKSDMKKNQMTLNYCIIQLWYKKTLFNYLINCLIKSKISVLNFPRFLPDSFAPLAWLNEDVLFVRDMWKNVLYIDASFDLSDPGIPFSIPNRISAIFIDHSATQCACAFTQFSLAHSQSPFFLCFREPTPKTVPFQNQI